MKYPNIFATAAGEGFSLLGAADKKGALVYTNSVIEPPHYTAPPPHTGKNESLGLSSISASATYTIVFHGPHDVDPQTLLNNLKTTPDDASTTTPKAIPLKGKFYVDKV
jgi:hypothetical protein